jgi:hypothetical protein
MIKRALLALLPFASPALAEGFLLERLPVACDPTGPDCYIQQYMDRDPGPGFTDYRCNGLSYDGHKGTDFALPTLKDMARGVAVLAAAPGLVAATRDGMPDTGYSAETAGAVEGRDCGNGVLLRHPGGWETQYCHLRQGSVSVRKGDRVEAGARLGLIGQSGRAQFPHLHLSVRQEGERVDPFDPVGTLTCDSAPERTLWRETPAYRPGGLIGLGFAARVPDFATVKAGRAAAARLSPTAPALVLFAQAFGTRKGDRLRLRIAGPGGEVLSEEVPLERAQALSFRAVGKKRRAAPWPAGTYEGQATLLRGGTLIESRRTSIVIAD